ncbi:hypothetical protein JQ506_13005 [Shinella sp. PSBB067]|uniref:hypothetical protein n=1 Tax=Shinella sp. PSBB067 TaxID=2715959 RepID=UPI00193C38B6|nr:hypothetical protein [Shinella sp. PSBB067]QRI61827.1 hypothetical protein JQ506_13005 [Shinella sp. PSBB067]
MTDPAPFYMKRTEIISAKEAARRAGREVRVIRKWCGEFGIGRKPAGYGDWQISAPALEMLLANDLAALALLREGRRTDPRVEFYFLQLNLVA